MSLTSSTTKRKLLRILHLVLSIPMVGYIYGDPAEVQEYASGVRFIFVPIIMLSGLWMYAGVTFAVLGVAVWLGAYYFVGVGTAILSMVALFIARGIWLFVGRG